MAMGDCVERTAPAFSTPVPEPKEAMRVESAKQSKSHTLQR